MKSERGASVTGLRPRAEVERRVEVDPRVEVEPLLLLYCGGTLPPAGSEESVPEEGEGDEGRSCRSASTR